MVIIENSLSRNLGLVGIKKPGELGKRLSKYQRKALNLMTLDIFCYRDSAANLTFTVPNSFVSGVVFVEFRLNIFVDL